MLQFTTTTFTDIKSVQFLQDSPNCHHSENPRVTLIEKPQLKIINF